jgi:hypothetical protein
MTAGRVRARSHLALEALVAITEAGAAAEGLRYEAREIMKLCAKPVSVAEIAGRLRVPVGTARVLVGDLVADGLVSVHQREPGDDSRPDVELLERVLDGLSAL